MSEMQNNRRHQAQKELGLDNTEEELQIEQSIQKEELRQMEKQLRRMEIEQSSSYRTVLSIAKWMDKFCLDPIIGFFVTILFSATTILSAVFQPIK